MARVAVIVPTYNRAEKVVEAIRSVLAQTHGDYEVWVVDDGSTDETASAVKPLLGERVHYVHQPNGGVTRARNHGIRRSHGDYVALLDSDDTCLPERLERQTGILDANPEAGLVFSDLWKVYPDGGRHRFTETVPGFAPVFRP
ncbi:MAG: glycosyltransferase family 2 protein, partial [Actinomycetota bacterium]